MQIVFQDPLLFAEPAHDRASDHSEGMIIGNIGKDDNDREQRAIQALQESGLVTVCARPLPHEFSGGQRQRIAIAKAIAMEPIHSAG